MPTADEKLGNFANPVCVKFDIGGNCLATGTQIPTSQWDPVAAAYVKDVFSKLPNPQDVENHLLVSPLSNIYNYRQEMVKVDHVFSPKLSASFRFMNDTIPTQEPTGLWTGLNVGGVATTSTNAPGRNILGRVTATFSPTFLMEAGYAYSYGAIVSRNIGLASANVSPDVMKAAAASMPFTNSLGRIPALYFDSGEWWGGFGNYDDFNRNHNWFANLTKVSGHHTIKWGGVINKYNKNENAGGNNTGEFDFDYNGLLATGVDPESPDTPGHLKFSQAWANFLLGRVSYFAQDSKDQVADMHQNQFELFLQDEWRIRPNLTLSYGVRYSLYRQPTEGRGLLTNFDPALFDRSKAPQIDSDGNIIPGSSFDPYNGIIIGGNSEFGHKSPWGTAVSSQSNRNFAPRFGFAWDPFRNGKTSIRGGYGIFYDSPTIGFVEDNTWINPPFVSSITKYATDTQALIMSNIKATGGVDDTSLVIPNLRVNGVDWHLPYTQQWSLDIQHELSPSLVLDLGYYGNKGTHLLGGVDLNQVRPGAALAAGIIGPNSPIVIDADGNETQPNLYGLSSDNTGQLNSIRPYPGYGHMNAVMPWFKSNYHSLQFSMQKRFKGESMVNLAYTWSKNMTNSPGDRWNAPQNTYDLAPNYGPALYDRKHILTASFVYELPFMKAQKGVAGKLLGGWQTSGIIAYNSGVPISVDSGSNIDRSGQGVFGSWASLYPDQIANPNTNAPHKLDQWFNTNAFVDVPEGQYRGGNERRGAVRGPGFGRWDLSLFKNFKLTEGSRIQFRAEAFNIWNHTNYSGVGSTLGSDTYGQITSTRDPRNVQLALKFTF